MILLLSPSAAPLVIRCRQKVRMLSRCRESISPTLRIGVRSDFFTQVSQRFMPLARHVEEKIWELRATGRDGIGRSLYVAASGKRLLILRSFIKKTQKTPRTEIEIAFKRLGEVE